MTAAEKLWAMLVPGPDDVYAMSSEAAALAAAHAEALASGVPESAW